MTEKSAWEEGIPPSADDSKEEVESPASPNETTTTDEDASCTEKKKKPKKRWSFRSFSFSKKDKQKPVAAREEQKQQTLPEVKFVFVSMCQYHYSPYTRYLFLPISFMDLGYCFFSLLPINHKILFRRIITSVLNFDSLRVVHF